MTGAFRPGSRACQRCRARWDGERVRKFSTWHLVGPAMDAEAGQALARPGVNPTRCFWVWRYGQQPLDEVGVVQIVRIAQRGGNRSAAWLPGPA